MATGLHNRVFDFLMALNDAGSADDAWKKTALFMGNLGAGCVGINIDPDGSDPAGMWTTPQWVQDMYWAEVYPSHDPKREYCRSNVTPYFYGKEFWPREPDLPEPRRRLDEEMASAGVRSVVAIPVHNFSDSEWGFFGFSGDLDAAEFGRLYEERGTAFHLAGIGAYIRMRSLLKEEQAAAIGISEHYGNPKVAKRKTGWQVERIAVSEKKRSVI